MIGLLDLIEEHGEAIEFDLIRLGLRLRQFPSESLSWRDLLVIIRHSPPTSATFRAMTPHWQRTPEVDLLRSVEHGVRVLAWQQTRDASKGRNYPDPLRLPWDEPVKAFGSDVLDFSEDFGDARMRAALDRVLAQMN